MPDQKRQASAEIEITQEMLRRGAIVLAESGFLGLDDVAISDALLSVFRDAVEATLRKSVGLKFPKDRPPASETPD